MSGKRTSAQMGVDTHVSRSATQTLPFPIRYVLFRLGIAVLFSHAKVYDMYDCST